MEEVETFDIQFGNHGSVRISAFCPICKSQVFGAIGAMSIEDMIDHMNEFHSLETDGYHE